MTPLIRDIAEGWLSAYLCHRAGDSRAVRPFRRNAQLGSPSGSANKIFQRFEAAPTSGTRRSIEKSSDRRAGAADMGTAAGDISRTPRSSPSPASRSIQTSGRTARGLVGCSMAGARRAVLVGRSSPFVQNTAFAVTSVDSRHRAATPTRAPDHRAHRADARQLRSGFRINFLFSIPEPRARSRRLVRAAAGSPPFYCTTRPLGSEQVGSFPKSESRSARSGAATKRSRASSIRPVDRRKRLQRSRVT